MNRQFFARSVFAVLATAGVLSLAYSPGVVADGGSVASARPRPSDAAIEKVHPSLTQRLSDEPGPAKAWVFFSDKGLANKAAIDNAIATVAATYNERAAQRRLMRGDRARRGEPIFDEHDVPVAEAYVDAVAATGAQVHIRSRWLNAVSVRATQEQIDEISRLPFVSKMQAVARSKGIRPVGDPQELPPVPADKDGSPRSINYGNSQAQLAQMNLIALHDAGYTGNGVIIGILDTGFKLTHVAYNNALKPLTVIAAYDFLNDDPNVGIEPGDPSSQHDHGTKTLSCIGAYAPGQLVGGAFDASFILAKTEDTAGEYPAEEDNYVAGLEFIELNGADLATSSLGYIDWYTQADLDGLTAVTTIAVNIMTSNGVHHCNAAGNEYHDTNPSTSSIIAPADGFQVITCGAVDSSGGICYFSSDGPTADGRVKPEILARGCSAAVVSSSSDSSYTTADGTSFSTPLTAAAIACLVDAKPYWTVDQMRQHVFETAGYYALHGTYDPQYVLGYGIINAYAAYDTCADAGVVELDRVKYACESTVGILVNDCGLNTNDLVVEQVVVAIDSESETGIESVTLTETDPGSAEFMGSIAVSETDAAGVLLVAPGNTITVTYIDADDGDGGTNVVVTATAPVDCTPPNISNIAAGNIQPRSATVTFDADELVRGTVHYGESCGALTGSASASTFANPAAVAVTGLQEDTTYYFSVEAEDQAGNSVSDDNGGACYTFTTPDIPDYFSELFGSGNDLDNLTLTFEPNGSFDFYEGCTEPITELPTDPTGGTALTLSDDNYTQFTLTGGASVMLYGQSYSTVYVGSNGYVTFTAGDSAREESYADHFDLPRISALFDDLNPSAGGTVSYKQLADRAVVTFLNVPQYNTSDANTFQIEMFFGGKITISYLSIAAADGLAGLSAGGGAPTDFYASDLSNMGACGPKPPKAFGSNETTPWYTPLTIALVATDDGLPEPASLTYAIAMLPAHGVLSDPNGGEIAAVPYTLASGGNEVLYTPDDLFHGTDSFRFTANDGGIPPEGGDSNEATVSIDVALPARQLVHAFPMDANPGWSMEGLWAFGHPLGLGSHNRDPANGYTGSNVCGYNLYGDYPNGMSQTMYLTTTAIDCTLLAGVELRFRRWLGVENSAFDHAAIEASSDGVDWVTIWQHNTGTLAETAWSLQTYDLSAVGNNASTLYIRWGMGPTDSSNSYPGWNIDDVEIWGVQGVSHLGDMNCDNGLGTDDVALFVQALIDAPNYTGCDIDRADVNGDEAIDGRDIQPFVELLVD